MSLFNRKERNVFNVAAGREKQPVRLYNCAMGCIIAGTLICDPVKAWIPAAALAISIAVGRLRPHDLYLTRIFAYVVAIGIFGKSAETEQIRNAVPVTGEELDGLTFIIPSFWLIVSGLAVAGAFIYAFKYRLYRQIKRAQKSMVISAVLTLTVNIWVFGAPDITLTACIAMITAYAALLPEMLRRLPPKE
ncbi:TPA: hypothetical protein ACOXWE_004578 [Salmonella enterica]